MARQENPKVSLRRRLSQFIKGKKRFNPSSDSVRASALNGEVATARESPLDNYEKVFRYFDQNGDGKVSPSELSICLRTAGEELSEKEAEAVISCNDSDGDGLLCYDDFVSLVSVKREEEEEEMREAFRMYEMKGRDCITAESLRRMLRRLGDHRTVEECKGMIRRYDLNGDGVLSFDEFKIMMIWPSVASPEAKEV
ncbi:putative calcium-binding protein CML31 [Wolffia australiana]